MTPPLRAGWTAAAAGVALLLATGCSSGGGSPASAPSPAAGGAVASVGPDGGSFARPPGQAPGGPAGDPAADGLLPPEAGVGSQPGYVPILEPFDVVADCKPGGKPLEQAACVQTQVIDTDATVDTLQLRVFGAAANKDAANAANADWLDRRTAACDKAGGKDLTAVARCDLAASKARVGELTRTAASASPSPTG